MIQGPPSLAVAPEAEFHLAAHGARGMSLPETLPCQSDPLTVGSGGGGGIVAVFALPSALTPLAAAQARANPG